MTTQLKFDTPMVITGNTKELFDEFYSKRIRIEILDTSTSSADNLTRLENIAFLLEGSFDLSNKCLLMNPIRYSNLFYDNPNGHLTISKNKRVCYMNILPYPQYSSYEAFYSAEESLRFEFTLKHTKDNSLGDYVVYLVS
jgi:hypothetical protein